MTTTPRGYNPPGPAPTNLAMVRGNLLQLRKDIADVRYRWNQRAFFNTLQLTLDNICFALEDLQPKTTDHPLRMHDLAKSESD